MRCFVFFQSFLIHSNPEKGGGDGYKGDRLQ